MELYRSWNGSALSPRTRGLGLESEELGSVPQIVDDCQGENSLEDDWSPATS